MGTSKKDLEISVISNEKNHAGQCGISGSGFSGAGTAFIESFGCRGNVLFANSEAAQIISRKSKEAGFSGIGEAVRHYGVLCGEMAWPFTQVRLKQLYLSFSSSNSKIPPCPGPQACLLDFLTVTETKSSAAVRPAASPGDRCQFSCLKSFISSTPLRFS